VSEVGRRLKRAQNSSLATATEDWSPAEGFDSRLGFSERTTALIRAAGIGDLRLVRLLVEAGAPVAAPCPCANATDSASAELLLTFSAVARRWPQGAPSA
jgi:hypothetical protein